MSQAKIEQQKLYRVGSHHGVTVLLTEDAYRAFQETMRYFDRSRSYEGVDPSLERRIATGTMTFVSSERWYNQPGSVLAHTGPYPLLDLIQELHNVTMDTSRTFTVPFTSGDRELDQKQLASGFGYKAELLRQLTGFCAVPADLSSSE